MELSNKNKILFHGEKVTSVENRGKIYQRRLSYVL